MAIFSKSDVDWAVEKAKEQYGFSAYLDPNLAETSRDITLIADTWTDVTFDMIEAHISGFSNGTGTDFISLKDFTGYEWQVSTKITAKSDTVNTNLVANMFIDDTPCTCEGGERDFKTAGEYGSFSYWSVTKVLVPGNTIHMKVKADRNCTITFGRLQLVANLRP